MKEKNSRYIQIDNWIFEIKTIRAIKTDRYGDPYSAIANVNLNGDESYIDGLMTKTGEEFTRDDFRVFEELNSQLNIKKMKFDRFKGNGSRMKIVDINEPSSAPILKLVEPLKK